MLNTHTCMIRMTLVDPRGLAGKRALPLEVPFSSIDIFSNGLADILEGGDGLNNSLAAPLLEILDLPLV